MIRGRTDTASRIIEAPRAAIYRALTDPEALARWLPPKGMTGRFEHFDLKPGGTYRMILTYQDARGAPGKSAADTRPKSHRGQTAKGKIPKSRQARNMIAQAASAHGMVKRKCSPKSMRARPQSR